MKRTKALFGILAITAAFVMNALSQIQIYQLSTPISGSMTMTAKDLATDTSGQFYLNFNGLSETIYLDTVSNTLRQVGTISYTPSAANIQLQETQGALVGNVTVNLAPTGSNLSFDTGYQPITLTNPSVYTLNGEVYSFSISGSYSLVTGGQTYNGSFSYVLSNLTELIPNWLSAYTFNTLSLTGYPSSIQLSGLGYQADYEDNQEAGFYRCETMGYNPPTTVADVTATNGFLMELCAASQLVFYYDYVGLLTYGEFFQWSSPTSVIATNVGNIPGISLGLYPGVTINGVAGSSYIIQKTTNLINTNSWFAVDNLTLTGPVQIWVDTNVNASLPGNPQAYYRVLPGP